LRINLNGNNDAENQRTDASHKQKPDESLMRQKYKKIPAMYSINKTLPEKKEGAT
jgi:hypothetical protein